jgi:hypothetical protein
MVEAAHSARFRAFSFGCGLLCLCAIALIATVAGPSAARADSPPAPASAASASGAWASMINGKGTKVRAWPWQVALAYGGPRSDRISARKRYFCSGSLIASDLVITAAHCVADFVPSDVRMIQVISGRTWLSSGAGSVSYVRSRVLPRFRDGRSKYGNAPGANWDVALLKLKRDLPGKPIKLAGATEAAALKAGRRISTTGWGVTDSSNGLGSNILRVAPQVILPDALCRRENGGYYSSKTMICLGGPAGNTSTCFGDSGGPMVGRVSSGWRLIGVTSFGDPYCDPTVPSVDTKVAGKAIRGWVRRQSLRLTGVNPIGSGGRVGSLPSWCRVPKLIGRTVPQTRSALRRAGCDLGRVRADFDPWGRRGRVSWSVLMPGWLAPLGERVSVWVNR